MSVHNGRKQRQYIASFSAKPKSFAMRSSQNKASASFPASGKSKKSRSRKGSIAPKYDLMKKVPDYTDMAYREAVSRLRFLLNESYIPTNMKYMPQHRPVNPEESDEESGVSVVVTDRTRTARLAPYRKPSFLASKPVPGMNPSMSGNPHPKGNPHGPSDPLDIHSLPAPPELMAFIERQEDYIEQLEKESQYCRDELSQLLGKVKDLIAENEALHEQQKTGVLRNVFNNLDDGKNFSQSVINKDPIVAHKKLEGPSIVFESRISELEAQLTQARLDLRKAHDEAETYRKKALEGVCADPGIPASDFYRQIDTLQREKRELNDQLMKLQSTVTQIKEKEADATKKIKRSLDVVDKVQFEKQQADMEVQRLKSELDHQHDRLLEVLSDQTKRVSDERSQAERRYIQHVEQLNIELTSQRDTATKLQLELEKHLRIEDDLKRDLSAKNLTIENVKKELNNKIVSLQSELSSALADRDSIEQDLNTSRMSGERTDRVNRQEVSRLQVEVTALKQRLERADADHMHSRRENLRLTEQVEALEKEIQFYKIKLGESEALTHREKELTSRIGDIETKHVETVAGLEGLIENQSQVMAQLKAECQSLTQRLEDSTTRHKAEMDTLQSNLDYISNKLETTFRSPQQGEPENIVVEAEAFDEELLDEIEQDLDTIPEQLIEERSSIPPTQRQFSNQSIKGIAQRFDQGAREEQYQPGTDYETAEPDANPTYNYQSTPQRQFSNLSIKSPGQRFDPPSREDQYQPETEYEAPEAEKSPSYNYPTENYPQQQHYPAETYQEQPVYDQYQQEQMPEYQGYQTKGFADQNQTAYQQPQFEESSGQPKYQEDQGHYQPQTQEQYQPQPQQQQQQFTYDTQPQNQQYQDQNQYNPQVQQNYQTQSQYDTQVQQQSYPTQEQYQSQEQYQPQQYQAQEQYRQQPQEQYQADTSQNQYRAQPEQYTEPVQYQQPQQMQQPEPQKPQEEPIETTPPRMYKTKPEMYQEEPTVDVPSVKKTTPPARSQKTSPKTERPNEQVKQKVQKSPQRQWPETRQIAKNKQASQK